MIKLKNINSYKLDADGNRIVDATLFADTKVEVTSGITGADVRDMLATDILDMGSLVITASAQTAYLNSSGNWVWGGQ